MTHHLGRFYQSSGDAGLKTQGLSCRPVILHISGRLRPDNEGRSDANRGPWYASCCCNAWHGQRSTQHQARLTITGTASALTHHRIGWKGEVCATQEKLQAAACCERGGQVPRMPKSLRAPSTDSCTLYPWLVRRFASTRLSRHLEALHIPSRQLSDPAFGLSRGAWDLTA